MRHLKAGRQLGRNSSHRKAMFRNMVVSLLNHESITTTDAKAKELRRHVEKIITLGKRGTLEARRRARIVVDDKEALRKLFSTLAERFKERPGGYTRIIKLGVRPGDNAPLSQIQLVQEEVTLNPKKTAKPKKDAEKIAVKEATAEVAEETAAEAAEEKAETATEAKEEAAEPAAEAVEAKEEPVAEAVEEPAAEAAKEPAAESKEEAAPADEKEEDDKEKEEK